MSRSSHTYTRWVAWLAGAVVTASLVAACGSAGPGQPAPASSATESSAGTDPPAPPQSSGPAPTSSAPAASPVPASPSAGNSGSAGLAACRTASLLITVDDGQAGGAAGSVYYPLNFTNTAAAACELYGYPGVSFVSAPAGTGSQIGAAERRLRQGDGPPRPGRDSACVAAGHGGRQLSDVGLPAGHSPLASGVPARRDQSRLREPLLQRVFVHEHGAA
jgi:hypothetical protein